LTDELANANETISFLSSITGQNPQLIRKNISNFTETGQQWNNSNDKERKVRQDSAVTQKHRQIADERALSAERQAEISRINQNRVGTAHTITSGGVVNNAANETKDAITGRIIHTVNMMKEVLQGNLGLRETIQKQSELIDDQNA
jgi:hypothetical protein